MNLVSVALATYNGERYVAQQLDSILGQDYPDIEICVSDDRSTDRTWEIVSDYAKRFDTIRLRRNEANVGYQSNFANALRMCRGDFVALCDQDDFWLPSKLSRLTTAMDGNLLIASDAAIVDDSLRNTDRTLSALYDLSSRDYSFVSLIMKNRYTGCTMMMKRELLDFALPFPAHLPHDWWLVVAAKDRGAFAFHPEVLTLYRQHSSNAIGVQDFTSEYAKLKSKLVPTLEGIGDYHSRRFVRYTEMLSEIKRRHFSRSSVRMVKRLRRYHEGFFKSYFRPRAFATSLWMSRELGDRLPAIARLGRAAKSLVGVHRPDLIAQLKNASQTHER